jgi:hypothetical protein
MPPPDRLAQLEQRVRLLTYQAEINRIQAELARHARWRTITVAPDGTARLPSDWQACVKPARTNRGCNSCNCNRCVNGLAGE